MPAFETHGHLVDRETFSKYPNQGSNEVYPLEEWTHLPIREPLPGRDVKERILA